jgi:hypothetical protein
LRRIIFKKTLWQPMWSRCFEIDNLFKKIVTANAFISHLSTQTMQISQQLTKALLCFYLKTWRDSNPDLLFLRWTLGHLIGLRFGEKVLYCLSLRNYGP